MHAGEIENWYIEKTAKKLLSRGSRQTYGIMDRKTSQTCWGRRCNQQLTSCLLATDSNQLPSTNFFSALHLDTDAATQQCRLLGRYNRKRYETSLCSASYVGGQRDTAHICCWASCCGAVAAEHRRLLSIDISSLRPLGAQQQTHRTPLLRSIDRWDRQTDGRTDARPFHRPCSAYYACSKKGKGSPYSVTERRVPELIPVLGSQPAGDVSHKPGGRLPLLSARPAVPPATLKGAATNFAAWWWVHDGCEQFA